jgi:hypothetical protein
MQMRTFLVAILVFAVCTPIALARKWTDSTGNYTTEAEFVDFKDGKVHLKKENGKIITFPIEKLSKSDQEYVKNKASKSDLQDEKKQMPKMENLRGQNSPEATIHVRTSKDNNSKENTMSPESDQLIKFRGKFKGFNQLENGQYIIYFHSDNKLPSGENYFGFYDNEIPKSKNNEHIKVNDWKGVRGKPIGTQTIEVPRSPIYTDKLKIFMIAQVEPILTGLRAEDEPWQSDILAFRKEISDALDSVNDMSAMGIATEQLEGRDKIAKFERKDVCWKMTFLGVNAKKEIEFQESKPSKGRGTFRGKSIDLVTILESEPDGLSKWQAIPRKTSVTCQATISRIQVGTIYNAAKKLTGWRINVFLEKAQPIE